MPSISTRRSCENMYGVDVRTVAREGLLHHGSQGTLTWSRGNRVPTV